MKNLNKMSFGGEDDDQPEETGDVFGSSSSSSADKGPKIPKLPLIQPNELSASDTPAQPLSANGVNFLLNADRKSQNNEQTEPLAEPEPTETTQEHSDSTSEASKDETAVSPQPSLGELLQNEQTPDTEKVEADEPVSNETVEPAAQESEDGVDNEPEGADSSGGDGGEEPPSPTDSEGHGEGAELPPQSVVAAAAQHESTPDRSSTTVIERGDAVGPAIVAFLAANYFRRRDKRRQKRINRNLNKQLETTQQQAATERQRTQAAERQAETALSAQRNRLDNLEQRHTQLQSEHAKQQETLRAVSEVNVSNDAAVKVSEVIAAAPAAQEIVKRLKHHQESSVPEPTEHEDTGELRLPTIHEREESTLSDTQAELNSEDEVRKNARFEEIEQSLQTEASRTAEQQAERQAELPPLQPVEKLQERRHEAKDDPRIAKQLALGTAAPYTAASARYSTGQGNAASFTPPPFRDAPSQSPITPAMATSDDLYRRAITNGVLMGVATIIIGTFAYLLFG